MSVIEVHPEELLDREQRGTLSATERELLGAHLVRCAACRMERHLRADFECELGTSRDGIDITGVVSVALQACELPAVSGQQVAAVPGKRASARRLVALLAACALLGMGVGLAGAQLGLSERVWRGVLDSVGAKPKARPARSASHVSTPPAPPAPAPTPALTEPVAHASTPQIVATPSSSAMPMQTQDRLVRARRSVRPARPAQMPTRVSSSSRSFATASAAPPPSVTLAVGTERNATTSRPIAVANAAAPLSTAEPAAARPSVPLAETSESLFERANRARHRGYAGEASELYRELQSHFPQSAEAHLSVALVARMQLDRGDLREALAGFERYLRGPDRALHEEAMVGCIKALVRLERTSDARDAARDLLALHPRSSFADEAKKLLGSTER